MQLLECFILSVVQNKRLEVSVLLGCRVFAPVRAGVQARAEIDAVDIWVKWQGFLYITTRVNIWVKWQGFLYITTRVNIW